MLVSTMAGTAPTQHAFSAIEQPRSFPFVPAQPSMSKQKNYVFVDEHNRHKRLKVMRACEGCRRRKIKCDSATTNTWPCAACIRLKLHCVPPSVNYDKDSDDSSFGVYELTKSNSYPSISQHSLSAFQQGPVPQQYNATSMPVPSLPSQQTYDYSTPIMSLEQCDQGNLPMKHYYTQVAESERSWTASETASGGLAEAFGSLQISLEATAPYITDLKQLSESEAVQEQQIDLPDLRGPDNRIRIPPEMMPPEHIALQHFEYFFNNVHPFVPVVSPAAFYQAWTSRKESISPLLLESMFACVTALMGKSEECARWLALAARHEESYKDVPRLSTVQAHILLLKAKEAQPGVRGYFYRSWVNLVSAVALAKDLQLHEHLSCHQSGKNCGSRPAECLTKTRIWQWLYIMETIIGGSQKRLDFSAHTETVDFSEVQPGPDASEYRISRQFRQFLLSIRSIRQTLTGYVKHHQKGGDWTFHHDYTSVEQDFREWMAEIPEDLRVDLPKDDTLPWIASPFIGFINSYHHLSIIMHHRPKIHYLMESANDGDWRPYLLACLAAAKNTSRILDAMFQKYGPEGMKAMLRGISFAVYAMLTCAMLHLAAITAPDSAINDQAREYFVRCMRLLEHISPLWPLESVKRQIDALREAFSADTSKPFSLRPGFPFNSPTPPPRETLVASALLGTPSSSIRTQELLQGSTASPSVVSQPSLEAQWNPSSLFNKWTSAFYATQIDTISEHSSPSLSNETLNVGSASDVPYRNQIFSSSTYAPMPYQGGLTQQSSLQQNHAQAQARSQPSSQIRQQMQSQHHPSQSPHGTLPIMSTQTSVPYELEYMTPAAWQDVVASSFVAGLKRRRYE